LNPATNVAKSFGAGKFDGFPQNSLLFACSCLWISRFWAEFDEFRVAFENFPVFGVNPKIETGENIPIYSEWRVDEAISTMDDEAEACGSGADELLRARGVGG
jgi:hypothetical protein